MADEFWFTDSSDDERAVEDILSQAMDHSVLEQIAAINCSSFSTSDNLPSDLHNRFQKLKSLPAATGSRLPPSKSKSFTPRSGDDSSLNERHPDLNKYSEKPSPYSDGNQDENKGTDSKSSKPKSSSVSNDAYKTKSLKSKSGSSKSEAYYSDNSEEYYSDGSQNENNKGTDSKWKPKSSSIINEPCKTNSLKTKSKSKSRNLWSPESESRSVSPAARRGIGGCLWCTPKKEKRKQGKENWGNEYDDVEFVKTFSMKEQKKIMRKAMKEEEKINREAEKIVRWAKQASARMMDVSSIVDDELTDFEDTK